LRAFFGDGIFLGDVAAPRFAKNFRASGFANIVCAIIHIVIQYDYDFTSPISDTLECPPDARGLVAGDKADGNGRTDGGHARQIDHCESG
jgi:hypothetical protein